MISLSASLLSSYLNVRSGLPTADGAAATSGARTGAQKRAADARTKALANAPWTVANAPKDAAAKSRLAAIMNGQSVVTDQPKTAAGAAKTDQDQLFGAYRALAGLRLIADRAQTDGVTADEMAALQKRFRDGIADVSKYLASMDLQRVDVPIGAKQEELQGVYGLRRAATEYVTGQVAQISSDEAVPGWDGLQGFAITANPGEVGETQVNIDLSQMGSAPRTLSAVVGFINGKLADAQLVTRLSLVKLPAQTGDKSSDPPRYAISMKGAAAEELVFSPLATFGAVTALTLNGPANAATARLTKFDDAAGGDPLFAAEANADPLRFKGQTAPGFLARASAKGPDGSTYVVGEVQSAIDGNLGLRGDSDVVLAKFDSAGRRVWTRTLGATEAGSGFGVAVAADGTVAVAGAIKGAAADQTSKGGSDAVVATFTAAGDEGFVRQIGGTADDEARAVAFGADGTLYVGGRTRNGLSGANGGGWDGFVASFSATGAAGFTRQFADSGDGAINALAVTADGVFAAGDTSGAGAVRKLDLAGADVWTSQTSPLGAGGTITSIAVDGAEIAIGGATQTADLGLGGTNVAANGGKADAFVAKLTDGAAPTAVWTRTFGGALNDSVAAVALSGGAVYAAGSEGAYKADGTTQTTRAVVRRLDGADGAEAWSKTVGGEGERAAGIVVDATGSSDLDALGLPQGNLTFQDSAPLVKRTALRAGDYFSIKVDGGSAKRIQIEDGDTMATLATKMNSVLRTAGKAEAKLTSNADFLLVTAGEGRKIELVPGAAGKDALWVLGMPAGEAEKAKPKTAGPGASTKPDPPVMPLNFRADLAFSDAFSARKVRLDIERVQNSVRTAFEYIYNPPPPPSKASANAAAASSKPSPAQTAQLANYQAGLARLVGGTTSDTSTTSTNPTLALFGITA